MIAKYIHIWATPPCLFCSHGFFGAAAPQHPKKVIPKHQQQLCIGSRNKDIYLRIHFNCKFGANNLVFKTSMQGGGINVQSGICHNMYSN